MEPEGTPSLVARAGFVGLECSLLGAVEEVDGLARRLRQMGATAAEYVEEHRMYVPIVGGEGGGLRSSVLLHGYIQEEGPRASPGSTARICHYSPGDPSSTVTVLNLIETPLYAGNIDECLSCLGYRYVREEEAEA